MSTTLDSAFVAELAGQVAGSVHSAQDHNIGTDEG
jgi:hypothetical protein